MVHCPFFIYSADVEPAAPGTVFYAMAAKTRATKEDKGTKENKRTKDPPTKDKPTKVKPVPPIDKQDPKRPGPETRSDRNVSH